MLAKPISSVRQIVGLTLVPLKSSKGKGTKTILPLVIEWLAVGQGVNILLLVMQKVKGWVACHCR